jgi:hypothetical protein
LIGSQQEREGCSSDHTIGRASSAACAQDIFAEIGTTMTAFPTAAHLVSWARWSPQVKQSAGRRKGNNER